MRKFLFAIFASLPICLIGQTIVSTTPQNKNVVLEEFTGINCGYCPQGHAIANSITSANPGRVVVINVHVGNYATPSAGQPDFRTSFGTSIANQSGLTGYPAGTVNRHVFSGLSMTAGKTAMGRGSWTNAANQILAQPSYVNIGATAEIDFQTRELTVYVEAYYTDNSPISTNKLNIALMQNNTEGPQAGATSLPYNHMHRLVHLLTGQWGSDITETTSGSLYTNTFTYTIPEQYNSISALIEDMELGIFIAEGNQEVITGIKVVPTVTNIPFEKEFNIVGSEIPSTINSYEFSPKIDVRSYGSLPLTNLSLRYQVNDEEPILYDWTGEISFGESTTITLPVSPWFLIKPTNSITINILDEDNTPDNNVVTSTISKAPISILNDLIVEVRTDAWGTEVTWDIKNSENTIVSNGGPYTNAVATHNKNVTLPNGQYTLTVYDSYGDGVPGGYIILKHASGTVFTITGSTFTSSVSRPFIVTQAAQLETTASDEILVNGSTITITSPKLLVESNWTLLQNENLSNYIDLNSIVTKSNVAYSASINPFEKTVIITIEEEIGPDAIIDLSFGEGLIDEDGLAITALHHTYGTVGTGINELVSASLYPNPTNGNFSINVPSVSGKVAVNIYSVTGSLVESKQFEVGNGKIDMNISQPKGVYYVTLTLDGETSQTLKLVVK